MGTAAQNNTHFYTDSQSEETEELSELDLFLMAISQLQLENNLVVLTTFVGHLFKLGYYSTGFAKQLFLKQVSIKHVFGIFKYVKISMQFGTS